MKTGYLDIDGYRAVIASDDELDHLRGEFIGLNGGADFYANDLKGLRREGRISLGLFLATCAKRGINPRKEYSGKFQVRAGREVHEAAALAATRSGVSLNTWTVEALKRAAAEALNQAP